MALFDKKAEIFRENHSYRLVLTDDLKQNITNASVFCLGKDIDLPCTFYELNQKINTFIQPSFENNLFKWYPQTRQLFCKKNNQTILMTEKEAEIISFLATQPNKTASRQELLSAVWHYQDDIHTHTLESHIYTLKQKLIPYQDEFIVVKGSKYNLI